MLSREAPVLCVKPVEFPTCAGVLFSGAAGSCGGTLGRCKKMSGAALQAGLSRFPASVSGIQQVSNPSAFRSMT